MPEKMTDANSAGPAEAQLDDLSARQRAFCAEFPVDFNGTQAAIRAGYSAASAKQQASRLLANPKIKAVISAELERRALDAVVKAEDVVAKLRSIAWATPGETWRSSDVVRALELIGRHLGMFTDKVVVAADDGGAGAGLVLLPLEHDCPLEGDCPICSLGLMEIAGSGGEIIRAPPLTTSAGSAGAPAALSKDEDA